MTLADALRLIAEGGSLIVDARRPTEELVELARASAKWGARLEIRHARAKPIAELLAIARAGRCHVVFDLDDE